jgi:hypothetical protein
VMSKAFPQCMTRRLPLEQWMLCSIKTKFAGTELLELNDPHRLSRRRRCCDVLLAAAAAAAPAAAAQHSVIRKCDTNALKFGQPVTDDDCLDIVHDVHCRERKTSSHCTQHAAAWM